MTIKWDLVLFIAIGWAHLALFYYLVIKLFNRCVPLNRRQMWWLLPANLVIFCLGSLGILFLMDTELYLITGHGGLYDVALIILWAMGFFFAVTASMRLRIR